MSDRPKPRWRYRFDSYSRALGLLRERDVDRLRTLLLESSLSVPVDVVAYGLLGDVPLTAHIDVVKRPFFDRNDLKVNVLKAVSGKESEKRALNE